MTALVLALVAAAPAPKPAPKADHPLVGQWAVESHVVSGKQLPMPGKPPRVTISADRWLWSGRNEADSCVSVDPKKDPPQIDVWVPTQGDVPSVARGIYRLDGDTLTVCYTTSGDRPTAFASPPKSGVWLLTLKRIKAD